MPRLTAEQKRERRNGIGSSDVAELLGISPYEGHGPLRLYAEKVGLLPEDEEEDESLEQKVGHALEAPLVRLYEEVTGFKARLGFETVIHRDPELAWRRCSLDARVIDRSCALEIKCVGVGMMRHWDRFDDEGIPDYVRVQCAWQMHVADLEEDHVVSLQGGPGGFRVYYVKRDLELEELIVDAADLFWRRVRDRRAPDVDGSNAAREYLERKYPKPPEDVTLEGDAIPDELLEIGRQRIDHAIKAKEHEELRKTADARLMQFMGEHGATVLSTEDFRCSWSRKAKEGQKRRFLFKARRVQVPGDELARPASDDVLAAEEAEDAF